MKRPGPVKSLSNVSGSNTSPKLSLSMFEVMINLGDTFDFTIYFNGVGIIISSGATNIYGAGDIRNNARYRFTQDGCF